MLYFISDTHFEEVRIQELFYGNDFFKSTDMYEAYIRARWKAKIRHDDDVIVVGDAGNPLAFADLPGNITLVRGNHDTYPDVSYSVFYSVVDNLNIHAAGTRIIVEHINGSVNKPADIRICGHSHNVDSYMYVSPIDTTLYVIPNLLGYEPRTLEELLDKKYHTWSYEFMQIRNNVFS